MVVLQGQSTFFIESHKAGEGGLALSGTTIKIRDKIVGTHHGKSWPPIIPSFFAFFPGMVW
jgi:hypothetical protein